MNPPNFVEMTSTHSYYKVMFFARKMQINQINTHNLIQAERRTTDTELEHRVPLFIYDTIYSFEI